MHAPPDARTDFPDQMAVLAGTLAHLSSYLQTGCPRSLHLARLLLHRLDHEASFDRDVLGFCRRLEAAVAATQPTVGTT